MALLDKATEFRPALRRRVHEDIAQQLRDAILDGRLTAGAKLPSERELALEFQVNRASIRDAMKVLEGLNLVRVRHGGGATVQPIVDASLDLLPAMIFRHGQIDLKMVSEMHEVVRPVLYEMARLALVRATAAHAERLRELHAVMADETRDQEARAAAAHDLLVAISDMTGNRVWQMLARRVRALLASEPLRETRARVRKDFRKLAALVAECMKHRAARRTDAALESLRRAIDFIGADFDAGKR
jgi:GntR family transcriptional repressor for pyruvate dehydrogenase complex